MGDDHEKNAKFSKSLFWLIKFKGLKFLQPK